MPRFSKFFSLGLSQYQLDFVDVSNEYDTPVYVDPYAIEIHDDTWSEQASEHIRSFFKTVLDALRSNDFPHAAGLMSHLSEPQETFLGVSKDKPLGRGVGQTQARQLISAIRQSKAYKTGLLTDLSEMALYVEGIDRDKISDLTTNIIRGLLVIYTQEQCELLEVPVHNYSGPPIWDTNRCDWVARTVKLPFIEDSPTLLVPKYIVRRRLSLDSQEFYNKQITDFLVAENIRANSALVKTIKGQKKVYKGDVREANPKSKPFITDMVIKYPDLLNSYKEIAKRYGPMLTFEHEDKLTITTVCRNLAKLFPKTKAGVRTADDYHQLVMGALTALFYPSLIQPHKEWEIHGGRKRIDIVFTNAADTGFFAHRRDDDQVRANMVIVECKNYSNDIENPEIDQLLGRFDRNRGKFGIIACRSVDKPDLLLKRCQDAASRSQGYILVLTDDDLIAMLEAKAELREIDIEAILHRKFRELTAS